MDIYWRVSPPLRRLRLASKVGGNIPFEIGKTKMKKVFFFYFEEEEEEEEEEDGEEEVEEEEE